jgi:hypothetical protein
MFHVKPQQKTERLLPNRNSFSAARTTGRSTLKMSSKRIEEMNRKEILRLLLNQAQFNGFEFRRWFQSNIQAIWPGAEQALTLLSAEGRHYTLLFSHEFAHSYWRSGAKMSFTIPTITYPRVTPTGEVVYVTRRPFTRRTIKPDVWKYHLRQMAVADDPVNYLCRFLPVQDQAKVRETFSDAPLAAQA